jgi:hypothetical protein
MIVLLVTGTRSLSIADWQKVSAPLNDVLQHSFRSKRPLHLIVGDATGVDQHTQAWFAYHEYATGGKCHVYAADWDAYGNAAGPKRNQQMVDDGLALKRLFGAELHCLAFPAPDSRGTHDCARRARAAGYNVTFHPVGY